MKVSESILKWLSENKDWFKDSAICKKVGIDKGNFSKYKKSGDIPEKYLQPIINIISPLGFKTNGVQEWAIGNKKQISDIVSQPLSGDEPDNSEILKQIADIKAEKIPKERDTSMGRKVWINEQRKKIAELQSKLIN